MNKELKLDRNMTFVGYKAGSNRLVEVYKDDNNILYLFNKGDGMGEGFDVLERVEIGKTVALDGI